MILQDSPGIPEKERVGQAVERSAMRQLRLVLLERIRRGAPHVLGSALLS